MSGFVFFIFLIIFVNVVSSIFKSASKPKAKTYRPDKTMQSDGGSRNIGSGSSGQNPWKNSGASDQGQKARAQFKAQAQAAGKQFAKSAASKKIQRQRQDVIDARADNKRNINDRNRSRIYNWGERAGPGFLTLTNMFVFLVLGLLALYVMSLMPADFGSSK